MKINEVFKLTPIQKNQNELYLSETKATYKLVESEDGELSYS